MQVHTTPKHVFFNMTLSCPSKADGLNLHHIVLYLHLRKATRLGIIKSHLCYSKSDGQPGTLESLFSILGNSPWPSPPPSKNKFPPKCMKSHCPISSHFTHTHPYSVLFLLHTPWALLNNCGLLGKSCEMYQFLPFLFKTDKGRTRKGDPAIPVAPGLFLASISFHNGSGPRNVIHPAPFRLFGLLLQASPRLEEEERGRGRATRQEGITDKNKDPANSGSP